MAKKPVSDQMELFEDGGFRDQGNTKDPISNNPVPVGSTQKEVRDDIAANLSEGEFVLPADVVRYHGLEKIMGFRDQAKQGLQKMEDMGQMGNSDQATLPDGTPFRKMAVGGLTPTVQAPEIQAPSVIPEEVPGVQYNPATPQGLRPSVYSYGTQMPQVDRPKEDQQQQQPNVNIPTAIQYGAQARPAYRQPTNTAATPTFENLIGAQYGQLQKSETKKYINPETKEELYIPFVNGEPIYPIPTGFIPADEVKEEEKKEKAGEVKSTSVRQEGEGSEGYDSAMDTSVTGGFESQADRDDQADIVGAGNMALSQNRGMANLGAYANQAVTDFSQFGKDVLGAIGQTLGSMIGGTGEKGISTSVQSDRLGSLGYTNQTDKNNLAQELGIDLTNNQTMAMGHNVGNINNADPNSVYSGKGVSVNVNKSDINYGAVTGYTGRSAAINAVTAMANVGYLGEIESIANMGGYAMSNPAVFSGMNKGREAIGLNSISQQQAQAALNANTPLDSKGLHNYGQELGKGTAVTTNGVYTGGVFTNNEIGKGKNVVGYNLGPGKGTVFSRDKNGKLTSFKGVPPSVQNPGVPDVSDRSFGDTTDSTDPGDGGGPTGDPDDDSSVDSNTSAPSGGFGPSAPSTGNVGYGGTNSSQSESEDGPNADGSESTGPKIICTAMNKMYGLPMYSNRVWMRYNKYKKLDSAWELGYHKIFLSLVKQMPTNKYIRNTLEWFANTRTHGLKEEMKGNMFTVNTLILRPLLSPIVYITGKLIQKGILKKVNVKSI